MNKRTTSRMITHQAALTAGGRMRFSRRAIVGAWLSVGALAMCSTAAPAQSFPSPSVAALKKACKIGSSKHAMAVPAESYAGSGFTPAGVTGAITVSAAEAKCVIDRFGSSILVADAAGEGTLPETLNIAFAGRPPADDKIQADLVRILGNASGGNRATPVLVYCHNIACGLSYYASQRIVAAGYTTVLWMRDGSTGWKQLGYPDSGGVSRFRKKPNERLWEDCLYDATETVVGSDKPGLLQRALNACRSVEPNPTVDDRFYPAGTSSRFIALTKSRFAERIGKKVDWNIVQGIGVPESELVTGYEYCFTRSYDHYTRVYPSRVGKVALELPNFHSTYRGEAQNARELAEKVSQLSGSKVRPGGCAWYRTRSEAEAEYNATITRYRTKRDIIDWTSSR